MPNPNSEKHHKRQIPIMWSALPFLCASGSTPLLPPHPGPTAIELMETDHAQARCEASPSPLQKGRGLGRGVQFCAATKTCHDACAPIKSAVAGAVYRNNRLKGLLSPRGGEGETAAAFVAPVLNSMAVHPGPFRQGRGEGEATVYITQASKTGIPAFGTWPRGFILDLDFGTWNL